MKRLEKKLHAKLNGILAQEELVWFWRSKTQWINDGDRNTRYYQATNRKWKNEILMLWDANGVWLEDPSQLHALATSFYKQLLSSDEEDRVTLLELLSFLLI